MKQGTVSVVAIATWAGMTGGGGCGRGCSTVLLLGSHRPLVIVGVPLLANLR